MRKISPTLWLGMMMLVGVTLVAIGAPWIAPHDPGTIDLTAQLAPLLLAIGSVKITTAQTF